MTPARTRSGRPRRTGKRRVDCGRARRGAGRPTAATSCSRGGTIRVRPSGSLAWPWARQEPVQPHARPGALCPGRSRAPTGATSSPSGPTPGAELMKLDGATRRFLPALGGESAFYAEPSPDGRWLAWARYPDGTLWRSRPDGSERMQLTSAPLEAHLPRWSPDGGIDCLRRAQYRRSAVRRADRLRRWRSSAETIAHPENPGFDYWDRMLAARRIGLVRLSRLLQSGLASNDTIRPRAASSLCPGAQAYRFLKCSALGDVLAVDLHEGGREPRRPAESGRRRLGGPRPRPGRRSRDGPTTRAGGATGGRSAACRAEMAPSNCFSLGRASPRDPRRARGPARWPAGWASPGWASTQTGAPFVTRRSRAPEPSTPSIGRRHRDRLAPRCQAVARVGQGPLHAADVDAGP